MSLPRRALGDGEQVVHELHPHWKALVLPTLAIPVVVGLATYGVFAAPDGSGRRPVQYAVLVAAVLLLMWWTVWPFVKWRTTGFFLTNRRIVTRTGVFARSGRDVPLHRVNDVSFTHSFIERLLRCGTLVVESAGERGQLTFSDVPRVEDVQREVYALIERDELRRRHWGDDADERAYDEHSRRPESTD